MFQGRSLAEGSSFPPHTIPNRGQTNESSSSYGFTFLSPTCSQKALRLVPTLYHSAMIIFTRVHHVTAGQYQHDDSRALFPPTTDSPRAGVIPLSIPPRASRPTAPRPQDHLGCHANPAIPGADAIPWASCGVRIPQDLFVSATDAAWISDRGRRTHVVISQVAPGEIEIAIRLTGSASWLCRFAPRLPPHDALYDGSRVFRRSVAVFQGREWETQSAVSWKHSRWCAVPIVLQLGSALFSVTVNIHSSCTGPSRNTAVSDSSDGSTLCQHVEL